jgi:hypothetical protein
MLLVAHRTPASRTACERLAGLGAAVFEADVQIDDRDRVVVSHFLDFGRGGLLQRDNWKVRWHTAAARDPRIADVAGVVPDDCLILLDLKEKVPERRARLLDALEESLPDRTRFRACGGRTGDLDRLRGRGFRTWRTLGDQSSLHRVLGGDQLPDDAVSVRHSLLSPDVVGKLHDVVPTIVAWTVNDVSRARELRDIGVDGVTTDRVAVMRALSGPAN